MFLNVSEVVRAALRNLEENEAKVAAFCAAIDEGDASLDAGYDGVKAAP